MISICFRAIKDQQNLILYFRVIIFTVITISGLHCKLLKYKTKYQFASETKKISIYIF